MIIKIGGTNGSGKSTVVREFIKHFALQPIYAHLPGRSTRPIRYERPLGGDSAFTKAVVLGPYVTACGGMDAVSDKDVRLSMVRKYCDESESKTLCVYEGVLTGVTYGAMGKLSEESAVPWIYVFLDTPYEECVRRVEARRKEKGNTTPFDGTRSLLPKIRACESVAHRAAAQGHRVFWLHWKDSPKTQVRKLLEEVEKCL